MYVLIELREGVSLQRATDFAEHLEHRYSESIGSATTWDGNVYVVRPSDPSEDAAVFAREVDAQAFADTFENVGDVERCLIIDAETTVKMVAERENEE